MNTLPELSTYSNSLLVLGLVLKQHSKISLPKARRLTAANLSKDAFNALYPINFVVKHPNLVVVIVQGPP